MKRLRETDPKVYLNQIRYIDNDIKSRQEEISRLRASIDIKASTIKQDIVQESHTGRYDDRYMLLVDKVTEMDEKVKSLVDMKIRVSNQIDLIDERLSRIILREKYLNLKTFEQIADGLEYDLRHIYKLHGQALVHFKDAMLSHCMPLR